MTRIDDTFARLRRSGKKAFVAYIMAGDPDRDASLALMQGLPAAGVDIIELGLPFTYEALQVPRGVGDANRREPIDETQPGLGRKEAGERCGLQTDEPGSHGPVNPTVKIVQRELLQIAETRVVVKGADGTGR